MKQGCNVYFFIFILSMSCLSCLTFSSDSGGADRADLDFYLQSLYEDDETLHDSNSIDDDDFSEDCDEDNGDKEKNSENIESQDESYYKESARSRNYPESPLLNRIADGGDYLFNDLMMDSLITPFSSFLSEYQDLFNHHIIDPVRRGKHYMRYMDSVMVGTFDNMVKESTGTTQWPYALVGAPYGVIVKNVITDFELGSEVRSPGVSESMYHNHPILVERLGAETSAVAKKMSETHKSSLVVIDVVKPFMPRVELWDEENSLFASLYSFYYATKQLVTDVHKVVDFEDTDYFKRTGRYEESDRTFLFHWNKTITKKSAFRTGQIVRVDRKGYFSMGPIPIAWNYCEVLLHEGGTKDIEVIEEEDETEIYYEHPETYVWGTKDNRMLEPVERTRTVRKKVIKQIPNATRFRVYTENLCQAAEASVRSTTEVIVFTTQRSFSWLVPGMMLIGAPSVSYLLMRNFNIGNYFPLTATLMSGVLLASLAYPSMWNPEFEDTMHSIKFPPPVEY